MTGTRTVQSKMVTRMGKCQRQPNKQTLEINPSTTCCIISNIIIPPPTYTART